MTFYIHHQNEKRGPKIQGGNQGDKQTGEEKGGLNSAVTTIMAGAKDIADSSEIINNSSDAMNEDQDASLHYIPGENETLDNNSDIRVLEDREEEKNSIPDF